MLATFTSACHDKGTYELTYLYVRFSTFPHLRRNWSRFSRYSALARPGFRFRKVVENINPAAAGPPRQPPAAGGHIFAHIFLLTISPQREGVEERNLAHTELDIWWMFCLNMVSIPYKMTSQWRQNKHGISMTEFVYYTATIATTVAVFLLNI